MMASTNSTDNRLDALEAKLDWLETTLPALVAVLDAKKAGDKKRFEAAKAHVPQA